MMLHMLLFADDLYSDWLTKKATSFSKQNARKDEAVFHDNALQREQPQSSASGTHVSETPQKAYQVLDECTSGWGEGTANVCISLSS